MTGKYPHSPIPTTCWLWGILLLFCAAACETARVGDDLDDIDDIDEICGNELDDDLDSLTDCQDPDCANLASCQDCLPTNPADSFVCHDDSEWWVDDCGVEGKKKQDCGQGCGVDNRCAQESKVKWCFDGPVSPFHSPALSADSVLYTLNSNTPQDWIYALNLDGSLRHSLISPTGGILGSAVVGSDGIVYLNQYRNRLTALYPDLSPKWTFLCEGDVHDPPAIGPDGTLYLFDSFMNFYAIDQAGQQKWRIFTAEKFNSGAVIGSDGRIFFTEPTGTILGQLHAISPQGQLLWSYSWTGWTRGLSLADDGSLLVSVSTTEPEKPNGLLSITAGGELNWMYETSSAVISSAAVAADGSIYFTTQGEQLIALDGNGSLKWQTDIPGGAGVVPSLALDGSIFLGGFSGVFFAFHADGSLRWQRTMSERITSNAAIGLDGTIYVATGAGRLCAFASTNGGLAQSAWPKYKGNNQNTAHQAR